MPLSAPALSRLVEAAIRAEHGCTECHAQADAFAEAVLAGRSPDDALSLVEAHLAKCPGCRDEFEALLDGVRANDAQAHDAGANGRVASSSRPWWQFWRR